jgi:hypothetical protein
MFVATWHMLVWHQKDYPVIFPHRRALHAISCF